MTGYADDFNRADSLTSAGANWTNRISVMGINGNAAYAVTNNTTCVATYNTPMLTDDVELSVVLGTMNGSGGDVIEMIIGASTGGEFALAVIQPGSNATDIYTNTSFSIFGGSTTRAFATSTPATADVWKFQRVSNVYTVLQNGSSIVTWTDSGNVLTRDSSHRLVGIGGTVNATSYRRIDSVFATDKSPPIGRLVLTNAVKRASFY